MKKIFSMFAKSAAPKVPKQNTSQLFTKVETFDVQTTQPTSTTEIVQQEEIKQIIDTQPRDSVILKNLAKSYIDLRVTENYNTYILGMQNITQEQKEVIEKIHYAVKHNTPIRYEVLQKLDPQLTQNKIDAMNKVENKEEKYKSMYDKEAEEAVGFLRSFYNENRTKPFREHYHE